VKDLPAQSSHHGVGADVTWRFIENPARKLGAGFVGSLNFSLANAGIIRTNEGFDGRLNRIRKFFSHFARPLLLLMACGEVHIYAKTQINY
jgi:hypothetical protein